MTHTLIEIERYDFEEKLRSDWLSYLLNFPIGGPENGDEAPNSRTIPNESGSDARLKCKDKRSWCKAADCSIDIVMLLCPKRCKVCNVGMDL